jgi:hypothetical protein
MEDGTKCFDTIFWVESPSNHRKALVTLQVIQESAQKNQRNSGKPKESSSNLVERFLSVELIDRGGEKVILIQPPPQIKNRLMNYWNPFGKLFS